MGGHAPTTNFNLKLNFKLKRRRRGRRGGDPLWQPMSVLLDTTFGSITIDLFTASAPRASLNFLKLCKLGAYRGCLFFNVQQGFVAQTGDPTGTGRAGSSVYGHLYGSQARLFEPEVRSHLRHARRGTVSMVPSAGGGHGSQFLVTLADGCASLDGRATVFGEVVQEGDTWPPALAALNAALCDEAGRPFVDARVLRAHVLVDPFDDPPGLAALLPPPESPPWRVPPSETVAPRLALNDAAAAAAEAEEAAAGRALSAEERAARARARAEEEARSRAVLLEMVGDLPSADVKPPDTALFVCKLNPVTTAKGARGIAWLPFPPSRAVCPLPPKHFSRAHPQPHITTALSTHRMRRSHTNLCALWRCHVLRRGKGPQNGRVSVLCVPQLCKGVRRGGRVFKDGQRAHR